MMSDKELLFVIIGWGFIISFLIIRQIYRKKKDKKIKDQEVKNFAKFMKIAADVEEMKKNKKNDLWKIMKK